MRWLVLSLVLVMACKKKEEPAPDPLPTGPPASGHSVTKVHDDGSGEEHTGSPTTAPSGSGETGTQVATAPQDAGGGGAPADAQLWGGNGKPAYRDGDGHTHGPGGPVFMGRGPDCTGALNHCLRDGIWFAVGTIRPGSLYRATPAFELESKWWDFRDREVECDELFMTKVAKASGIVPGNPVVWIIQESQSFAWLNSESDAMTSSRWEVGIISDSAEGDTFKVKGWDNPIGVDTARIVVQRKKCPGAG